MPNGRVFVLWTDQAEYYYCCHDCYSKECHDQWGGSTKVPNFAEFKREVYKNAPTIKICELCKREI